MKIIGTIFAGLLACFGAQNKRVYQLPKLKNDLPASVKITKKICNFDQALKLYEQVEKNKSAVRSLVLYFLMEEFEGTVKGFGEKFRAFKEIDDKGCFSQQGASFQHYRSVTSCRGLIGREIESVKARLSESFNGGLLGDFKANAVPKNRYYSV